MATIFIFNLIITIDKNLYVIYNILYNQGVFIMENENENNKVYIKPFIILFLISIVIFAIMYFLHSKNIENRFNRTLQNYEKSMSAIFNNMVITNRNNENIYTNLSQTNNNIVINNNQLQNNSIENLKLSFEVGFKMLESSMNEIMKNSNDILQFWFAFLSLIMIVFTIIGFFLNNNILNQAREQLEIIKDKSEILIQGLENKYNSAIKDINKRGEEESKKLTEESDLFNLGLQSLNSKNYQPVIYYFTEIIKLNPENSRAYNNRGLAKYYLKDYEGAIEDYNEAIRLNANFSEPYNNRGVVKYALANTKEKNSEEYNKLMKEAMKDYNEAIKINPNFSMAYYNMGNAKIKLQKIKEAIEYFIKAYKLDNDKEVKENSKNELINLAKEGYEEAIKFCEEHNINYKE